MKASRFIVPRRGRSARAALSALMLMAGADPALAIKVAT